MEREESCAMIQSSLLASLEQAADRWQSIFTYSFWLAAGLGILATACGTLAGYAQYQLSTAIPQRKNAEQTRIETTLGEQTPNQWPAWYLEKRSDWFEQELEHPRGFRLFVSREDGLTVETKSTDIVVKDGDQTVLWAEKHVLGAKFHWAFAEPRRGNSTPILDGENAVSIKQALSGLELGKIVRYAEESDTLDIIGVGLDSFAGSDNDPKRKLSKIRGRDLAVNARTQIDRVDGRREPNYRSLGLGKALTPAVRDSADELRQRSVVIIVVARKRNDERAMSAEEAMATITMGLEGDEVDLSGYEFSGCALAALSNPVDFSGGGDQTWLEEGPSTEDPC
jgi:hypothetical protein